MKYKTVSALCEGIADAIREKEGSSALINPQDFADRIKGLEVGGASGSSLRYFKTEFAYSNGHLFGCLQRFHVDGQVVIVPTIIAMDLYPEDLYDKGKCVAFAFDTSIRMYMDGEWKTVDEVARITKYCEEITEEQFYDLNTLMSE